MKKNIYTHRIELNNVKTEDRISEEVRRLLEKV
jgi:hypothetical protein